MLATFCNSKARKYDKTDAFTLVCNFPKSSFSNVTRTIGGVVRKNNITTRKVFIIVVFHVRFVEDSHKFSLKDFEKSFEE